MKEGTSLGEEVRALIRIAAFLKAYEDFRETGMALTDQDLKRLDVLINIMNRGK